MTKIQLETLLIDVLADNLTGKIVKYDEKADFRLLKSKISRGSFNRTLKQSKENVIKSVYTILLLGYLGIFETPSLNPYLEIASKLQDYIEAYSQSSSNKLPEDNLKIIEIIREELEISLNRLSSPTNKIL